MRSELVWFSVRLMIPHLTVDQARLLAPDLQEELELRPHLRNSSVTQGQGSGQLLVSVETEAPDAHQAGAGMAEELFEATCAVLTDTAGLRIEIVDVQPLTD